VRVAMRRGRRGATGGPLTGARTAVRRWHSAGVVREEERPGEQREPKG
jgi:hypothetical protein